jgi:xanthine dehydrogenase YagR molybdenum-binding subunit
MRDGHDLVDWGMASVIMSTFANTATARATIDRSGDVLIEAGTQEIFWHRRVCRAPPDCRGRAPRGTRAGSDPPGGHRLTRLREHQLDRLVAEGTWAPTGVSMHTVGPVFAEVRVDADLWIPRVSRVVSVYSAGRIVNPKTARSQMTGG